MVEAIVLGQREAVKEIASKVLSAAFSGEELTIILLGVRRVGKTYVLKKVLERLREEGVEAEYIETLPREGVETEVLILDNAYKVLRDRELSPEKPGIKAKIVVAATTPYRYYWLRGRYEEFERLDKPDLAVLLNLDPYGEEVEELGRERFGEEYEEYAEKATFRYRLTGDLAKWFGEKQETVIVEEYLRGRATPLAEIDPKKWVSLGKLPELIDILRNTYEGLSGILPMLSGLVTIGAIFQLSPVLPVLALVCAAISLGDLLYRAKKRGVDVTDNLLLQILLLHPAQLEELERAHGLEPGVLQALREAYLNPEQRRELEKRVLGALGEFKAKVTREVKRGNAELLRKVEEVLRAVEDLRKSYLEGVSVDEVEGRLLRAMRLRKEEYVELGPEFEELVAEVIEKALKGLVIITGPSGAGKTRLLYAVVRRLIREGYSVTWLSPSAREITNYHLDNNLFVVYDNLDYGDRELLKLLAKTPRDRAKRIIVTTRAYVLNHLLEELTRRYGPSAERELSDRDVKRIREAVYPVRYPKEALAKLLEELFEEVEVEEEALKLLAERAETSWRITGMEEEISPTLYYVVQAAKYLKRRKVKRVTRRNVERISYGLLNLEAEALLKEVGVLERGYVEREDALVIYPLIMLAIHGGKMDRAVYNAFREELAKRLGVKGDEKTPFTYVHPASGKTLITLPHDSWEILLDTTPMNEEYEEYAAEAELAPQNYIEKLSEVLRVLNDHLDPRGEYIQIKNPRPRAAAITQAILSDALKQKPQLYKEYADYIPRKWARIIPFYPDYSELLLLIEENSPYVKPLCETLQQPQLLEKLLVNPSIVLCERVIMNIDTLVEAAIKGVGAAADALRAVAKARPQLIEKQHIDALAKAAENGEIAAVRALRLIWLIRLGLFSPELYYFLLDLF